MKLKVLLSENIVNLEQKAELNDTEKLGSNDKIKKKKHFKWWKKMNYQTVWSFQTTYISQFLGNACIKIDYEKFIADTNESLFS